MLCLSGANALSTFRQEQLLKQLRSVDTLFQAVEARYVYFVQLDSADGQSVEADPAVLQRLCRLLQADEQYHEPESGWQVSVVPRLGTRSAWSSKATDIVRRCGMTEVVRVERGIQYLFSDLGSQELGETSRAQAQALLHDRMTESVIDLSEQLDSLFAIASPAPLVTIPVLEEGRIALEEHNRQMGLALSSDELDYLEQSFARLKRDPSDAELMMFAQANSEHCRHKIFNASWSLDGEAQSESLFGMIRYTHKTSPEGVLSAYHDNAAVIAGSTAQRWLAGPDGHYQATEEPVHIQIKVETHNHPTAISPFPGAATGSGGEIRD